MTQSMTTVSNVLRDSKTEFLNIVDQLSYGLNFRQEATFAHQQIERTLDRGQNSLVHADPLSIRFAFLEAVSAGLTLDVRKQRAFLIPRWDSAVGVLRCHLDVGYRGYQYLASRAGLTQLSIELVYENDHFEFQGMNQPVIHKTKSLSSDPAKRGPLAGGYAMAQFGDKLITSIVSPEHLLQVQQDAITNSRGFTPWNGPYMAEMYRKTICRKAWKDWEHQLMASDVRLCFEKLNSGDEDQGNRLVHSESEQEGPGATSAVPQLAVQSTEEPHYVANR